MEDRAKDRVEMSQRAGDVLKVMSGVLGGERRQAEAARLLRRSVRPVGILVRRWPVRSFRSEGWRCRPTR